jgi:nicotinate-nucleotide adenylyltransferase
MNRADREWRWGRGHSPLGHPATSRYRTARGIFGGTFDPPHIGHLILAEAARSELGLSEVVFMPAAQPPHKQGKVISPTEHRVAMVQHAIASNGRFATSLLDAEREGPNYTVDTMRLLREEWGNTVEIYFIMGLDSLIDLPSWYQPLELLNLVKLAVVARPGYHADMASLERALPGIVDRVIFVPAPLIGISSTAIRTRVQEGDSIRYLVPHGVETYIYEHQLYLGDGDSRLVT